MRKSTAKPGRTNYRIQVLERAFDILDDLAANGSPANLASLSTRVKLHKSTTHRILSALESRRYVERSASSNEFRLGLRLFELGMRAVSRLNSVEVARPFLERLVAESGETAHMGIMRQGEVVSIANVESHQTLRTPATVGRRSPLHCSSQGKCLLAFLSDDAVMDLLRGQRLHPYTPRTITDIHKLRRHLERVRTQGFAMDDEEFETGLRCIGAPVRDHSGKVVAALSIAGPAFRISRDRIPDVSRLVKVVARELSQALGNSEESSRTAKSGKP